MAMRPCRYRMKRGEHDDDKHPLEPQLEGRGQGGDLLPDIPEASRVAGYEAKVGSPLQGPCMFLRRV